MELAVQERLPELLALCRRHGISRLSLFGSAARGDFDRLHSDLDFLAVFSPSVMERLSLAYFDALRDLEQLFGRPIDLVTPSSIDNPFFLEQVEREEVVLCETVGGSLVRNTAKKSLYDAISALAAIGRFVHAKSIDQYLADEILQAAVERKLELVGEALTQATKADPSLSISNLRQIVGMRIVLAHRYGTVDHRIVWNVAVAHAPALKAELENLYQSLPDDPSGDGGIGS